MRWPVAAYGQPSGGELPRYEICKTKQECRASDPEALNALEKHFADAKRDRMDGLAPRLAGKWLLRPREQYRTIVRIVAETATAAESRQLCARQRK